MSTRSSIAVQHADGTVDAVYCHFDGYLEGVGEALLAHHNSLALAEALVALGDLRCVQKTGNVEAYSRDRGEEFETVRPTRFGSLLDYAEKVEEAVYDNGYRYIWENGRWVVWGRGVEKLCRGAWSPLNLGAAVATDREQRSTP